MVGETYGRLTVLEPAGKVGGKLLLRCRCVYGTKKVLRWSNLREGATRSCGCLARERRAAQNSIPERRPEDHTYMWDGEKRVLLGEAPEL